MAAISNTVQRIEFRVATKWCSHFEYTFFACDARFAKDTHSLGGKTVERYVNSFGFIDVSQGDGKGYINNIIIIRSTNNTAKRKYNNMTEMGCLISTFASNPFNVRNMPGGDYILGTCFFGIYASTRSDVLGQVAIDGNRRQPIDTCKDSWSLRVIRAFITLSLKLLMANGILRSNWMPDEIYIWNGFYWFEWEITNESKWSMVSALRLMAVHWPIIGSNTYSVMRSVLILCTTLCTRHKSGLRHRSRW